MKTKALFLTALTSFALVSCTESEFLGESTEPVVETTTNGAIVFGGSSPAMTRADFYGADAAAKLGNKFVVYGTKHFAAEDKTAANDAVVYNNFQVAWAANTAGKTASNTSDWEYVGLQSYDATPTAQGIKYWDYSADYGYTFYAFSSPDISYPKAAATDKVQITKTTADGSSLYNKGYAVTVKNGAALNNLYFSDRLEVPKAKYDQTVSLTFRNLGSKVRFGFYETIPGYTVQIDQFYIDNDATAAVTSFAEMNNAKTDGFYASLQNVKTAVDQDINVTYYESTTATQVINRPKVSNPTGGYNYSIKIGDGTGLIGTNLGTTALSPTWADGSATGNYVPVFPFEGNTNPLLLKLDFTMYADDGSDDVIHVKGARAIVPAMNVQWKSNFAYTYIFKISDKTNGTTGDVDGNGDPETDPEGLKPITFDAIVVDMTEDRQETITSVATNSITTYAEGAIVNEYTASKPIYVAISDNSNASHPVITPTGLGSTAGQAQIYKLSKAATEAEVLGQLTGSPMGITMTPEATTLETTIPLANGTTPSISNVKFTPSAAATYYAYVYTRTAYAAPTYTAVTTGNYSSSVTYYMQSLSGAYYAVSVPTEAAYEANLAKLSYIKAGDEGTAGVYDVKVIKVQ